MAYEPYNEYNENEYKENEFGQESEPVYTQERPRRRKAGAFIKVLAICLVCVIAGTAAGVAVLQNFHGGTIVIAPQKETQQTAQIAPGATQTANVSVSSVPYGGEADGMKEDVILGANAEYLEKSGSSYTGSTLTASGVYDLACSSVVGISTEIDQNIFGQVTTYAVSGTGFIISESGYVITNHHVIENAARVSVIMYGGEKYPAQIVGYEAENDIAVLKIEAEGLRPVVLGSSADIKVGHTVYCIGNPLGELTYTMTSGIISALNREIATENTVSISMFQMDAAVNSGNSGGPVFNDCGEVVGVVTAKYAQEGVEGIGFAIPIDDAVFIAEELIENGYVTGKPNFGISIRTIDKTTAQYYNMVVGSYVAEVEPGSAAEKAGMKVGDIIVALGGRRTENNSELTVAKKAYRAGDEAEVTVWRNGEEIVLTVIFDEAPREETQSTQQGITTPSYPSTPEEYFYYYYGYPYYSNPYGSGSGGSNPYYGDAG